MPLHHYNRSDHLTSLMHEFGTYCLSYLPPEGSLEAEIQMTVSSEADLSQMLRILESFLQATGYEIEGKELALQYASVPAEFDYSSFGLLGSYWGGK